MTIQTANLVDQFADHYGGLKAHLRKPLRQSVDEGRAFVVSALRAAQEVGSGARFLVYSQPRT